MSEEPVQESPATVVPAPPKKKPKKKTPPKNNGKHPGGRPSDYSPDIIEKAKDYLENYDTKYADLIPSVAGLAVALEVGRSTIYEWANDPDKKEFADILERSLSTQEKTLLSGGLSGKFNSAIAKLALGKHGYKEQTDVTSAGQPIINANEQIEKIYGGASKNR